MYRNIYRPLNTSKNKFIGDTRTRHIINSNHDIISIAIPKIKKLENIKTTNYPTNIQLDVYEKQEIYYTTLDNEEQFDKDNRHNLYYPFIL